MKATSTALALGVLASNPTCTDAFVTNPRLDLKPCSSSGGTTVSSSRGAGWAVHEFSTNNVGAKPAQGSPPAFRELAPCMSLAEWKHQNRRRSTPNGSHIQQYLEDFTHVKAITGGVSEFMSVIDESRSGDLVTVMTYMPWCRSCKYTRQRLRTLAEAHTTAGNGAAFYEMDLSSNPEVHEMLDIHAAPTVLLYMAGQLVDEFVCGGENGSKTLVRHIEAQIGPEPERA